DSYVYILDSNIAQPVGFSGLAGLTAIVNSAELAAVTTEDPVDTHLLHVVLAKFLPAEQFAIKVERGAKIRRSKLVPGKLAHARVGFRFVRVRGIEANGCALRILEHGVAAAACKRSGADRYGCPELSGEAQRLVDARHG